MYMETKKLTLNEIANLLALSKNLNAAEFETTHLDFSIWDHLHLLQDQENIVAQDW